MTFPREGKFTSSHFLPQKMLWVEGGGGSEEAGRGVQVGGRNSHQGTLVS